MHAITILNLTLNKYNQHSSSGIQHTTGRWQNQP